jgi:hypothetical protein
MTTGIPPFVAALGSELQRAAPAIRRHLAMSERVSHHQGAMIRSWRRGWIGRLAARVLHLEGDPGCPFQLRNELVQGRSGDLAMLWHREHSPGYGLGCIRYDASRRLLVDSIGARGRFEVELVPSVEDSALVLRSRRQWIRLPWLRLPLPRILFGVAEAREWEQADGGLGLALAVRHPWFGPLAGYEAVLREVRPR